MRNFKIIVTVCLLLVAHAAKAVIIEDEVTIDNWFNKFGETKSWTHDINDDGFNVGFDAVNSAEIFLDFQDDERDRVICLRRHRGECGRTIARGFEFALIVIEDFDFEDGGIFEIDSGVLGLDVGLTGLISLNDTGLLSLSVKRLSGDFYLHNSTLFADVTVPEPASLALLGLGLAGLGLSRRRKA